MAAQFTEITLDEMDRFLKRAWRAYRPKQGTDRGEVYYDLFLSDHVMIRVWTTIHPRREMGAEVGADAIRIMLMAKKTQRPLLKGKAPIVKRTQGWKNSLQDRIEDAIETYEDREGYFEERAGGEPTPPSEPAHQHTLVKLPSEERPPEEDANLNLDDGDQYDGDKILGPRAAPPPPPPPRRTDLQAIFRRLPNGVDWGLQVEGEAHPGDRVLAVTKGGKKQYLVVGEVLSTGRDRYTGKLVTVTTIAPRERTANEEPVLGDEEQVAYSYEREA